jgi:hypothetical protein
MAADDNRELTPEELEQEDVTSLPNREAMSTISGAAPLPIYGPEPVPVFNDPPTATDTGKEPVPLTDPPEYIGPADQT